MVNSQDINLLRPDVAANAKLWLAECKAKGLDIEISNTVRDNEYQAYIYAQGRTRPGNIVTNGKTTTFHGAGLAIDFYSASKKWGDHNFFVQCAAIAKKHGFSWAGDWKKFTEYCHIQWDNHGKSNHKNAPQMPLYKEEEDMTPQEVRAIVEKALAERDEAIAQANAKIASWSAEAWNEAKQAGLFDGTRPGAPLTRQEAAIIVRRIKEGNR
jgi:peptidoglycan L-alanyl-D-glutamate endopeptidase CwlK